MATKRTWTIGAYEGEDGLPHADQDKLAELLSDLMGTLRSVGGQFIVAAQRVERDPGSDEGLTVGYVIQWQPYVPMARAQVPAMEPDPMPHEDEPEPIREPVEA